MTFLILSTFIFWPYLVHRPNFRPCAPPEFKANHRNLTFFVSFGPIPECNSAASWIRPLLWKLDTPNQYRLIFRTKLQWIYSSKDNDSKYMIWRNENYCIKSFKCHTGWWRVMLVYMSGILAGSLWTSVCRPDKFLSGASGGVYALITAHLGTVIMNYK